MIHFVNFFFLSYVRFVLRFLFHLNGQFFFLTSVGNTIFLFCTFSEIS